MYFSWLSTKSIIYSILLHVAAGGLLVLSFQNAPKIAQTTFNEVDIVNAVTVDSKQVEIELQRLKNIENAKQKKQNELEKKVKDLEKKRKSEEKKLATAKKKNASEKKKRISEQQKLATIEKQRKEEEKKLKLAEVEKKRKKDEEKKRLAEARIKQEAERKKKEAEEALKIQLAEEQKQRQQVQAKQDAQLLRSVVSNIYRSVVSNFNKSGLSSGLECALTVRLIPSGDVINVSVSRSSGNELFDRRAIVAIEKASPLPVPNDVATFDRLNLRNFNLVFRPEN